MSTIHTTQGEIEYVPHFLTEVMRGPIEARARQFASFKELVRQAVQNFVSEVQPVPSPVHVHVWGGSHDFEAVNYLILVAGSINPAFEYGMINELWLSKPPRNQDEATDLIEKLKAQGIQHVSTAYRPMGWAWMNEILLNQHPDSDREPIFNKPSSQRPYEKLNLSDLLGPDQTWDEMFSQFKTQRPWLNTPPNLEDLLKQSMFGEPIYQRHWRHPLKDQQFDFNRFTRSNPLASSLRELFEQIESMEILLFDGDLDVLVKTLRAYLDLKEGEKQWVRLVITIQEHDPLEPKPTASSTDDTLKEGENKPNDLS